ncbi:MAG TPA: glycosyl hydrolase family 18 protein [Candidatus Paceibacterota bacterium]|nr:glycosyl hydrolase family 18 protein [Candidatus Paceibacterota bacterium]
MRPDLNKLVPSRIAGILLVVTAAITGVLLHYGIISMAPFFEAQTASVVTALPSGSLLSRLFPDNQGLLAFGSIPYWDQDRAVRVFKENVEKFDIISLFWYRLEEDGTINPYSGAEIDSSLIEYAHANNVKVLALISNLPEDGDWDPERVDAVIDSPDSRARHIAEIVALVEEHNFDGVNIDYEFLLNRQKNEFSAFIEDLSRELHLRNKIVAVAIHAHEPGSTKRGQDVRAIAQHADILAVMAFDEHWQSAAPGPIASIEWVRGVLEYILSRGVDPKRVFLCIPLFGYDWTQGIERADGLEYTDVVRVANREKEALVQYDEGLEQPHFIYTDARGNKHDVWFENARSFEAKLELAKELDIAGLAFWRLGGEDDRIYELLE